ncbi:MAG: DUF1127 domain-containing protein [Hahellaceae bacterium]|nr:DUF1127 domain-containing protein [Hahellaceae bacterium]MCP5169711.1 DUF1127 domain-containing protein [Hahellaceae bacterium]
MRIDPIKLLPITLLKRVLSVLKRWHARYRQRQMLAQLSSYELKDMGITRSEATEEVNKPFWQP